MTLFGYLLFLPYMALYQLRRLGAWIKRKVTR